MCTIIVRTHDLLIDMCFDSARCRSKQAKGKVDLTSMKNSSRSSVKKQSTILSFDRGIKLFMTFFLSRVASGGFYKKSVPRIG
jgi:hypothetical protein